MTLLRDHEAERLLLSSVLSMPTSLGRLLTDEGLRPEHFATETHGAAFAALVTIAEHGDHIDRLTFAAELERANVPDHHRLVQAIVSEPPEVAGITSYARRIMDLHHRRQLKLAAEILADAADRGDPDRLAEAEALLTTPEESEPSTWSGQQLADRYFARMDEPAAETFAWPFSDLDSWTGGLRRRQIVLIGGWTANGKALDVTTEIPTPDGWRQLLDIRAGDHVYAPDGFPTRVLATTEVQLGRPCFEVEFSDGATIIADAEHEWLTWTEAARRSESSAATRARTSPFARDQQDKRVRSAVVTTAQIAASITVESRGGRHNHSVPLARALVRPRRELPVDPYVLGAWLGDGTSRSASITTADPEILGWIADAGHAIRPHAHPLHFGIGGLQKHLRALGLLQNKHIPREYLEAAIVQRQALLQGLMDTDGCVSQKRCEFTSTNRRLADDVLELALGLGLKATMIEGRAVLEGRDCGPKYRIGFMTDYRVFRLPRKLALLPESAKRAWYRSIVAVRPVPSRPVKCIQVERSDGLFLVGRSCITTHNSVVYDQILEKLAAQGLSVHSYINEMSVDERMDRTLARLSGVPFPDVFGRRLTDDQKASILSALSEVRVGMTECAGWSAADIARHIRWNRWDVAGVDILHEIAHREERDLAEIAQTLRAAAKQTGCALIACVHLNDNRVTTPQRPVPVLRDVRGSGMLVRGADVVLFIHRDDDSDGVPGPEGVLLAPKIRNGQPSAMRVIFQATQMRFVAATREERY